MDLIRRLAAFEQADLYVVITKAFCAGRTVPVSYTHLTLPTNREV